LKNNDNKCNFCEKSSELVDALISDSKDSVYICNECISHSALYLESLDNNSKSPSEKTIKKDKILETIELFKEKHILSSTDFNSMMKNLENFYDEIYSLLNILKKDNSYSLTKINDANTMFAKSNQILLNGIEYIIENEKSPENDNETEEPKYDSFLNFKINVSSDKYIDVLDILFQEIELEFTTIEEEYKEFVLNKTHNNNPKILYPIDFREELDRYVVGQEHSKKTLSIAASSHLKRINSELPMPKSNVLLIGPTGSGKTLLIKTISNLLNLPLVVVDATSFTSSGYKGNDVSNILATLYRQSEGDTEEEKLINTQKGIVFIDEFDKLKSRPDQYINTERVQQELLKMIEGTNVEINISENEMIEHIVTIDSSNILFVFSGAFVGLDKIINKRKGTNTKVIALNMNEEKFETKEKINKIQSQDLINYGIIPELIGRIPYISELQKLSIKELYQISCEVKNSPIELYQNSFLMDNKKLIFEKEALLLIAEEAHKLEVGGRGLQNIIDTVLFELLYDIHSLENEVIITRDYVESKFYKKGLK